MRLKILLIYTFLLITLTAYYTSNYTNIAIFPITNKSSFLTTFHTNTIPQNSLGETVVAAQKMNTLYVGVDNPLTIVTENMDAQHLKVTGNPIAVKKTGKTTYNARANRSGKATITIEDTLTHQVKIVHFEVKHLPCPTVKFGGVREEGGRISAAEIKSYSGMVALYENTDFEVHSCSMISFTMVLVRPNDDDIYVRNRGGVFSKEGRELINQAKASDTLHIIDVKCYCPLSTGQSCIKQTMKSFIFQIT